MALSICQTPRRPPPIGFGSQITLTQRSGEPATICDVLNERCNMMRIFFTGRRLWMTLLVIIGALILGRLGIWQLDRLAQRRAFNSSLNTRMSQPVLTFTGAPIDPDALEYRRVAVRGVYDPAQEIVL